MIKDENLKQAIDYSEGQKTAAYMILGEIVNLLDEFSDNLRIIGGWVPTLLYPDSGHVNVISVVPYLVMKAAALGRGKPKDAYDIYCTIDNYQGGVRALASEFEPHKDKELVRRMCQKLDEKFASIEHVGPVDVATFMGITDEEEKDRIKQDAYQKVRYLVSKLKFNWT